MIEIESELAVLIGMKVIKVEVISICHMLRLYFDSSLSIDLPASWRLRSDKKTILGSSNIDYYVEIDDTILNEDDQYFSKKVSSLVGKKLSSVSFNGEDLFFEFSNKRYIDLFNLSSDEFSFIVRKN